MTEQVSFPAGPPRSSVGIAIKTSAEMDRRETGGGGGHYHNFPLNHFPPTIILTHTGKIWRVCQITLYQY